MARNVQVEFPPDDSIQIELGREDPIERKDELRVNRSNVVVKPSVPFFPTQRPRQDLAHRVDDDATSCYFDTLTI